MNQYANDFTHTVRVYYDDLKNTKPLTRVKEKRLLRLSKRGDTKARNELLEANLKFVFDVAKRYSGRGVPMGDLISEGNLGLIKAIEKFDESNDVKFISYAVWWIRHSMLDAIQKRKLTESVELESGVSNDNVFAAKLADDEDDEVDGYNPSPFEDEGDTRDKMNKQNALINKMFSSLNQREMNVISHYFGIDGNKKMNLIEIGEELGITSERVRQIKGSAIKKMRSNALLFDNVEDFMFK
ncbi:MAG: sigma-70 family RNA polymerase sigma factor [Bacteroidaceae bacterium]|nr:sigma-70 family RNA polymerase sigma factor [Bacteroidaceae bacterium]